MPRPAHAVLTVACCTIACGWRGAPPPAPPPSVVVSFPEVRQEPEGFPLSGTVVPQRAGQLLAFTVPGRVVRVGPREGEAVRRGQVLAALDAVSYAAGRDAARAQVRAAEAAQVRAADERRRMALVYARQSLAENDYLKFELAERAAAEQLAQARANEAVAAKALSDATLVAPVAGVVTRRLVEPGAMLAAGQPALEVSQLDPVEIQVGVPENHVAFVRVGQPARVVLPAVPGAAFDGEVRVLNAAADPASRTFMARVAVPNPRNTLRLGMVAEARIRTSRRERLLLVPLEAIVPDARGQPQLFEYVANEGRVAARRVTLGRLEGERVEVRAGIDGATPIVTAGQYALRDGDRAQLTEDRTGARRSAP